MKILFFGCQKIATDILKVILDSEHELVGVVTHDEDRDILFSEENVQEFCFRQGIPAFRVPDNKKLITYTELFKSLNPDILFSIYYRRILPSKIISLPKLGGINLHPSLLPRDRGSNPTYWNVRRGDIWAGTTLHYIDAGMDTGDIIAQRTTEIEGKTGFELNRDIMDIGVELFTQQFESIMSGKNDRVEQNSRKATCNVQFANSMRYIDWNLPAEAVVDHVRAHADPYGQSITCWGNKEDEIFLNSLSVVEDTNRPSPGPGSFEFVNGGLLVQTHTKPVFAKSGDWGSALAAQIINKKKGRFIIGVPT